MLTPVYEKKFLKEVKLAEKRGKDLKKLGYIIDLLLKELPLPLKYRNHKLIGNYSGCFECHIEPDWLLIYKKTDSHEIILVRTGTHSDLF